MARTQANIYADCWKAEKDGGGCADTAEASGEGISRGAQGVGLADYSSAPAAWGVCCTGRPEEAKAMFHGGGGKTGGVSENGRMDISVHVCRA